MSSDPLERSRRKDTSTWMELSRVGVIGFLILSLPIHSTFQGLSAAAMGNTISVMLDPGQMATWMIGIVAVMLVCATFVGCETALTLLRTSHLKALEDDTSRIRIVTSLLEQRVQAISACVLGGQTMRAWLILMCAFPADALANVMTDREPTFLHWIGLTTLISIPVVGINVVVSDLIAKGLATIHPVRTCVRYALPIRLAITIFAIPVFLTTRIASLITNRFGASATFTSPDRAEDEIRGLVESFTESGEIEEQEQEMIDSVFEFGDTVAREVMTPRVDVESVPVETTVSSVIQLIETTGLSRFPVFEGTDDQIVGILHAKDVLSAMARGESEKCVGDLKMHHALFVPETKPLHQLLTEMRSSKSQMVIVQDEFGGTAGIVTVEDIVEEVVGEIVDEYDPETHAILQDGEDFVVDGKLHLDDVNGEIDTDFRSEEFDTLGGYLFGLFGRQPVEGETLDDRNYRFTVEKTDGRRIERVRISRLAEPSLLETLISPDTN